MARIILIDDDHDLSDLTKTILVQNGYQVMIFHEAESALIELRKRKADLVLMDVMLPGMSGAEAIREIKHDPQLSNIPVILLTGLVSSRDVDLKAMGLQVDGITYQILGKPYEIKELLDLIKRMLTVKS